MKNPLQPLVTDDHGTLRFKENKIVSSLLDFASARGMDMNKIACMEFSDDDMQQFAQLIGYSLSGYGDLSYVDDAAYEAAENMLFGMDSDEAMIKSLQYQLDHVNANIIQPLAKLMHVDVSDLEKALHNVTSMVESHDG